MPQEYIPLVIAYIKARNTSNNYGRGFSKPNFYYLSE